MTEKLGFSQRLMAALVRRRDSLPPVFRRVLEYPAKHPNSFFARVAAFATGGFSGRPPVTEVPDTPVRVYFGSTNYAGQAFLWGRALEGARPGVLAARNMAVEISGTYGFPADTCVSVSQFTLSARWAREQWLAARQFTHVLFEAERALFGREFRFDVAAEVAALRDAGVSVAFMAHGTDVRDPRLHRELTAWSPHPEDPRTAAIQEDARKNVALLNSVSAPIFFSTADLASFLPGRAVWCPVVANRRNFFPAGEILRGSGVRVIHPSTHNLQKGSALVLPAVQKLQADMPRLEYAQLSAVPSVRMPAEYAASDIVLDQFRLGVYGVAACEGMLSARVVVGHVLPVVRERVRKDFGIDLPIVEATPDTLERVLRELIENPDRAREIAARGPEFVRRVHSGEASARTLLENWIEADPVQQ